MKSGYIEEEMDFLVSNIQRLIHAELERHIQTLEFIHHYTTGTEPQDIYQFEEAGLDLLPGITPEVK